MLARNLYRTYPVFMLILMIPVVKSLITCGHFRAVFFSVLIQHQPYSPFKTMKLYLQLQTYLSMFTLN